MHATLQNDVNKHPLTKKFYFLPKFSLINCPLEFSNRFLAVIFFLSLSNTFLKMPNNIDSRKWLKRNIQSENINYVDHNEFTELKVIGEGGFGIVKSAEWKNRSIKVALKRLKDENVIKEFVKEVCKFSFKFL